VDHRARRRELCADRRGARPRVTGVGTLATIADDRDDRTLVRGARNGDREALEVLLRRHYDRLHALCFRLTGNEADALDATQEALISVARGLDRFDERSSFSTWAYRVATNAALDELRRRRRRPQLGVPLVERAGAASSSDHLVAERLDVDQALRALPPEFRAPVVLRDLCALSYDEIAAVLEIPAGTVRSRIARARTALAGMLGDRSAPGPGNQVDAIDRPNPAHD
jgi:RNA polymerase sigma-70 factor (ECF subfamily)